MLFLKLIYSINSFLSSPSHSPIALIIDELNFLEYLLIDKAELKIAFLVPTSLSKRSPIK